MAVCSVSSDFIFQSTTELSARQLPLEEKYAEMQFQSTLPRRERPDSEEVDANFSLFQSTLPRRERLLFSTLVSPISSISIHAPTKGATPPQSCMSACPDHFNPRSHEGSDQLLRYLCKNRRKISIHAPTKGATIEPVNPDRLIPISIHAPTKGATAASPFRSPRVFDFNPRSHEGSDRPS